MNSKHSVKIAAVLAAVLMLTGAVMTGCGENNDSSAATTASTTAPATTKAQQATTAAAANGATAAQNNNANSSSNSAQQSSGAVAQTTQAAQSSVADSQSSNSDTNTGEEKHGNITSGEAAQIALQHCEYGLDVTVCDPATYDGQDCWHVAVRDTVGGYYDCFVTSVNCVVDHVQSDAGGVDSYDAEVYD